jgi:hypothetical protein
VAIKEVLILVLAKLYRTLLYFKNIFSYRFKVLDLGWLPLASYSIDLFNDRILLKDYKLLLGLMGLFIRLASFLTVVKS